MTDRNVSEVPHVQNPGDAAHPKHFPFAAELLWDASTDDGAWQGAVFLIRKGQEFERCDAVLVVHNQHGRLIRSFTHDDQGPNACARALDAILTLCPQVEA
jgi:hypothetical protein